MNTDLKEKERVAMERLKTFEPEDGYFLAYSGGKDSDCIKILAQLAGVKFEAVHNLTTVDAPETVQYVKAQPDVRINRSYDRDGTPVTMWNLIVRKGTPPLRISRYCCSELKEPSGTGKIVVTGVRWAESTRRKQSADVVRFIGKPKDTQKSRRSLVQITAPHARAASSSTTITTSTAAWSSIATAPGKQWSTLLWIGQMKMCGNFSPTTAARAIRSMNAASSASAALAVLWPGGNCGWRNSGVIPATGKPTSVPSTKCLKKEQPKEG